MTDSKMQLEDWLDDLCVRFIINLPEEDLSSVARICFQVEEAQWFYEDFIRPLDPSLPSMSLRSFCLRIFQHCPLLSAFSIDNHMQAFEEFLLYKTRVPVRGAIMLNHDLDAVVLVKGWKKGANWSFPRGKINKDEDDLDCAIREVYEETGFDIRTAGLVPEADEVKYIDIPMREQHIRLYVFRDVPMDTHFEPRTRKEISKIEWYRLSDLPAFRKKNNQAGNDGDAARNANKFYMVAPFLVPLKKWIQQQKKKDSERVVSNQYMSSQPADEGQTEEEGFRSTAEGLSRPRPDTHVPSTLQLNTLEGATAALQRLLKMQPATQGLQPAEDPAQYPATKSSGGALLALLRGQPQVAAQQDPPKLPHTPMELSFNSAPMPPNPHHRYSTRPQNPPESGGPHQYEGTMNNLDRLRMEQSQNYGYPGPQNGSVRNLQSNPGQRHPAFNQGAIDTTDNFRFPSAPFPGPQSQPYYGRQAQFLQHPQPLPPQIQPGVFTGGQVHGPILPPQFMPQTAQHHMQQAQQQTAQHHMQQAQQQTAQHHMQQAQQHIQQAQQQRLPPFAPPQPSDFQNVHGPVVQQTDKPSPPLLTSHSLALLDAFRNQERAVSRENAPNDHLLARFAQGHVTPTIQIQELSSEQSPFQQSPFQQLPQGNDSLLGHVQRPPTLAAQGTTTKSPPTDAHKSSLLNLFKSPATTAAPLARPTSWESPPFVPPTVPDAPTQPSPVPAIRSRGPLPDSNLAAPSIRKTDARAEFQSRGPEPNQPFRPTAILARPSQPLPKPSPPQSQYTAGHGKALASKGSSPKHPREIRNQKKRQAAIEAPPQVVKPFAPQILKRPPPGLPPMPAELSAVSPTTTVSPPMLPAINVRPAAQPTAPGHKQALLSLFKKVPESAPLTGFGQPKFALEGPLAAGGENTAGSQGRRSSNQTPISSTDKGFLLGYLDTIAKGGL